MPAVRFAIAFLSVFFVSPYIRNPATAASKTRIDVQTNGVNAQSNISVSNNSKTQTDILMEINGQAQEYHSDTGEDVTLTSPDGKSVITVNSADSSGQSAKTGASATPSTPRITLGPSQTPVPSSTLSSFFTAFIRWLGGIFR